MEAIVVQEHHRGNLVVDPLRNRGGFGGETGDGRPNAGGIAVAIPLGIFGTLVGGTLNVIRFGGTAPNFDFGSLMTAVSGAMLLLFCYRCLALRAPA